MLDAGDMMISSHVQQVPKPAAQVAEGEPPLALHSLAV